MVSGGVCVLIDSVNALFAQGKRILRQVLIRSSLTFSIVWAVGIVLGIAFVAYRNRSVPATPTWMFVVGVTALPAMIAGQLAGAVTVLFAFTRLAGAVMRLPQTMVQQLSTSVKDVPELALLAQKGGRGSRLTISLLSALGVALMTTMLTPLFQPPAEKPPE
jgi:hypothetical protein